VTEDEFNRALIKAHSQLADAKRKLDRLKAIRRRACLHCNEQFIPYRKDAKFCGAKCRAARHNRQHLERKNAELEQLADSFYGS
jgi:transcriptional regulator NrdR family protein